MAAAENAVDRTVLHRLVKLTFAEIKSEPNKKTIGDGT